MDEAFTVVLVCVVVAFHDGLRGCVSDPARSVFKAESTRLKLQHAWLRARLKQAWHEDLDQETVDRIADEIEATQIQLAGLKGPHGTTMELFSPATETVHLASS